MTADGTTSTTSQIILRGIVGTAVTFGSSYSKTWIKGVAYDGTNIVELSGVCINNNTLVTVGTTGGGTIQLKVNGGVPSLIRATGTGTWDVCFWATTIT